MKYALFGFASEKSCEVGESRWILREDPEEFNNFDWDSEKEIMVAWPQEFSKVSEKIFKSTIDPASVETTTCIARVIRFSDYDDIRNHIRIYCDTGSTGTPNHGRGQRKPKKNARYLSSNDEESNDIETETKKFAKKQKTLPVTTEQSDIQKLKDKYNFTQVKGIDCFVKDEIASLTEENVTLKKNLKEKDKEIEHLHTVIQNLKRKCVFDT